eukprot:TRINITY_DN25115_c0_g1_i1.p1 TRINITY_DN25115_c0_g1~~TRINITY_DN25115_c0_g1_i1.p1  ORF type:complete len:547 (+),score=130.32 TRINITY_DN25115_c0_g1_i1:82-1722(+)
MTGSAPSAAGHSPAASLANPSPAECAALFAQVQAEAADAAGWEAEMAGAKRADCSRPQQGDWQHRGFASARAADFAAVARAPDCPPGAVARFDCRELSAEDFWYTVEPKGLPVIIEGIPQHDGWPAWDRWSWQDLCRRFAQEAVRVGRDDDGSPVEVQMGHFAAYMAQQRDDSPLYLFDSSLGGEGSELLRGITTEYSVPRYFADDYMAAAGDDEHRPPYRWLLIGPARSGTTAHQDPLSTSAWNTLLRGRKRWAVAPPSTPPDVAQGLCVMKEGESSQAVSYFADLVPRLHSERHSVTEFVQQAGDTVYIPGGWWHCVLNLEDTVAVTHNYCGRNNFPAVWSAARAARPCWSMRWLRGMSARLPLLAARAQRLDAEAGFDLQRAGQLNRERRWRKRARRDWRSLRWDRAQRRSQRRSGACPPAAEAAAGPAPAPPAPESPVCADSRRRYDTPAVAAAAPEGSAGCRPRRSRSEGPSPALPEAKRPRPRRRQPSRSSSSTSGGRRVEAEWWGALGGLATPPREGSSSSTVSPSSSETQSTELTSSD